MHLTHHYFKLPSASGREATCGTPFAKEYLRAIESGQLRSADSTLNEALGSAPICAYWKSNRSRIQSQFTVWEGMLDKTGGPGMRTLDGTTVSDLDAEFGGAVGGRPMERGAILPPVCVSGTVTRRAVEKTWMTASNPKLTRIGSELKAMVQAPPGHSFVGADVDSQELWIAAVLGDAYFAKSHGSTALGWMTLQGSKSQGTDMHSASANVMGVSRDEAKILNYARIYGAAQSFAERSAFLFSVVFGVPWFALSRCCH
jgi:DNA polymerase gamma 1